MVEWTVKNLLSFRGVPRVIECLASSMSFAIAAGGWMCSKSTTQNEFLIATGAMVFVWSGVHIYYEGREELMTNRWLVLLLDVLFFLFAFASSLASIADSEVLNCGYDFMKAAAILMFLAMISLAISTFFSISDAFGDGASRSKRRKAKRNPVPRLHNNYGKFQKLPGNTSPSNTDSKLKGGWSMHTTEEGYEYYFHAETGKSQWHKPE